MVATLAMRRPQLFSQSLTLCTELLAPSFTLGREVGAFPLALTTFIA